MNIFSSFLQGLKPREWFFHSLVGREGVTDTSMKTSTSGYIQRRMIKILEDIFVSYDGTIRKANTNQIIQYLYGNNYLNPSYSILKKNELFPLDVSRLVEKINIKLSGRVVTKISLVKNYCTAEEYHQRYLEKR